MLNITLNSALEAFKSIPDECEIVVVDNSNNKIYDAITKGFPGFYSAFKNIKILHHMPPSNHAARMLAAKESTSEYILCVDSHMIFGHNVLSDAFKFIDSHKGDKIGFYHFPMRKSDKGQNTGVSDIHSNGTPYLKRRNFKIGEGRKIFWKFMPWMCNRKWYLDKLQGYTTHAKHHIVATGGEMLQQIKSWMLGYENWIMPTNPIIHIGPFNERFRSIVHSYKYRDYPLIDNYPMGFGVILAFYILGGDDFGYEQAKKAEDRIWLIHKIKVDPLWKNARRLGKAEHQWLMKNKKIDFLKLLKTKPWNN